MLPRAAGSADPQGLGEELIVHYSTIDGSTGFVLDRSHDEPVLKFDSSLEMFILQDVPGPRGDTIYKLDNGFAVLRHTNLGGMILFDDLRPEGRPVMRDRVALRLTLPRRFPAQVKARAAVISKEISDLLGSEVVFEAEWEAIPSRLGTATLADAVELTGIALKRLAEDDLARDVLAAHLRRVTFQAGDVVDARLINHTLAITFVWTQGMRGRFSSDALVRLLEAAL